MRICYLGAFRLPNFDAAASRVVNNAKAMRAVGHDVSFISWGGASSDYACGDGGKSRCFGFEYVVTHEIDVKGSIFKRLFSLITRGNKTIRILGEQLDSYDVVIVYNPELFFSLKLLHFCKRNKKYLISDITEWYSPAEFKGLGALWNELNMRYLQKIIPNKIVISTFLAHYYQRSHNILVPPLLDISDDRWCSINHFSRQKGPYRLSFFYAGTPGRKDDLLDAVLTIQRIIEDGYNIEFVIAGLTNEQFCSDYPKLRLKNRLSSNIRFLGRVSQEEVMQLYQMADYMILLRRPSRKNEAGFATKFAESIMSLTPVVANYTSDYSKYLIDGKTGWVVKSLDPDGIREAIMKCIEVNHHMDLTECRKSFDYHSYSEKFSVFLKSLVPSYL